MTRQCSVITIGRVSARALLPLGVCLVLSPLAVGAVVNDTRVPGYDAGRSQTAGHLGSLRAGRVLPGDYNNDGWVDLNDYAYWPGCTTGPGHQPHPTGCDAFDVERDNDVDLSDFTAFQRLFTRCASRADCDDGRFCNGNEWCEPLTGTCGHDVPPCTGGAVCDEVNDICVPACGNGVVDSGEECDAGGESAACDANCTLASCGDSTVNATRGEECDPPNGTTCDADCQRIDNNDNCATPTSVSDGVTEFSSVGATTDGPAEAGCGFQHGDLQIGSDIWFCHQATCNGPLVISLCGSAFDTKMAVYSGCGCPGATPMVCSDDDCGGASLGSRVALQATQGQPYLIRVGGFEAAQGSGIMTVLCNVDVCGPGSGDCMSAHPSGGCDDEACCEETCATDQYCCDVEWDDFCVCEAEGVCSGSFTACGAAGAGDCSTGNSTPGCSDVVCCESVCAIDPFCCCDTWDDFCANEAATMCYQSCVSTAPSCFLVHPTPGCNNVTCCEKVCPDDPHCCMEKWDQLCADAAARLCR